MWSILVKKTINSGRYVETPSIVRPSGERGEGNDRRARAAGGGLRGIDEEDLFSGIDVRNACSNG
jgi:hypothetical protein